VQLLDIHAVADVQRRLSSKAFQLEMAVCNDISHFAATPIRN
jgi:hypothetical protein